MKNIQSTKNVLILDTTDTAMSIIAQSVLKKYLRGVNATSAGINAAKKIDENTTRVLKENGLFSEDLTPKSASDLDLEAFDLVIALSEYSIDKCPNFDSKTDIIAIEYEALNPKSYSAYKEALKQIQMEITPIVRMHFES